MTTIETKKQTLIEPYIGPQPFGRDLKDQRRFFGRDYEADEIVTLILGHRLVLVYAQSGAGKTSILNAKIVSMLENYDFQVLPFARIGNISKTEEDSFSKRIIGSSNIKNMYMLNAIQSLLEKETDPQSLLNKQQLSDFLKYYYPVSNDKITGEPKAQVLVFDQLEELFTFYPNDRWREQQKDFFEQVAKALKENALLRIVFVIREDYLAELDPFLELLPERLRPRFRLERLRKGNAFLAIKGPLETMNSTLYHSFKKEIDTDIDKIIDDLLNIKSLDPFSGKIRTVKGQFIEPIHLQIVCQRWWQKQLSREHKNFSSNDNILTSVDESLKELYESAIHKAVTTNNVSEEKIRKWCEKKLITPSGTRALVYLIRKSTEDEIPSGVIDILESNYLIRAEWRSGSKWYELTHDRLIGPIKSSNQTSEEERNRKKKSRNLKVMIPSIIAGLIVAAFLVNSYITDLNNLNQRITDLLNQPIILPSIPPISTINVGQLPSFVSVNPNTNLVYVTNYLSNTVSVIDGKTNNVTNNITDVGNRPYDVAVNPTTNLVYVTHGFDNTVSVINASDNTVSVIDGKTNNNTASSIAVEESPNGVAVNPTTNLVYVTNVNDNTVSVINGKTNSIVQNLPVGVSPRGIAVNPTTNLVYVTNIRDNTVSVINGTTNEVLNNTITDVGNRPFDVAVNPNTNLVYVTNLLSNTTSVINGTTNSIVQNITIGDRPNGVAVNPNTNQVYVANKNSNSVSVIDGKTNSIVQNLPVGASPRGIAVNPNTNIVYAANSDDNTLTVVNIEKYLPSTIQVGKTPNGVAVNPNTNQVYVANVDSNSVSVIDGKTNSIVQNLTLDEAPNGVAVNPNTNLVYVTNSLSNTTSVINGTTNSIVQNLPVGDLPIRVAVNPTTNLVYVANLDSDTISVIDGNVIDGKTSNKTASSIAVDELPAGIAVNPNTNLVYVTNFNDNTVSVINGKTNSIVQNLPVGVSPRGIAVNPTTNLVYVANLDSDTMSVINGTTNVVLNNTITVGNGPIDVAVNPDTNLVYVANLDSDTISVIDGEINSIVQTLAAGDSPGAIDVDVNGRRIYVVNRDDNSLKIITL